MNVSCDCSVESFFNSTFVDEYSPFFYRFVATTIAFLVIVVNDRVKWVSGSVAGIEVLQLSF